jgi:IS4 transposase
VPSEREDKTKTLAQSKLPYAIETQAAQKLDSTMDIVSFITLLDLPTLRYFDDVYNDSYTKLSLEDLVKIELILRLTGRSELKLAMEIDCGDLNKRLGCNQIDVSTINRNRDDRLTGEIENFLERCTEIIGEKALEKGVEVPGYENEDKEKTDEELAREHSKQILREFRETVYPSLELFRDDNWSIPENTFFDLQASMGLSGDICANQAARNSLMHDNHHSGDNHREQLKKISVTDAQGMFQDASRDLFKHLSEVTDGEIWAAIDITTIEFTGDTKGREKQIPGNKEGVPSFQYATINIIGENLPSFVLGIEVVKKGYRRKKIVERLLDKAEEYVDIDLLMMDREFGVQSVADVVDRRGIDFLAPRRITGPTMRQDIRHMKKNGKDVWVVERSLPLNDRDESYEGKIAYVPSTKSDDPLAKTAFLTNIKEIDKYNVMTITDRYSNRWSIECDYKKIKNLMGDTRSKSFTLRFFYFMFGCLLHNVWRVVDLNVRIRLAGEGEKIYGELSEPLLTARDFMDLFEKEFIQREAFFGEFLGVFFGVDSAVT